MVRRVLEEARGAARSQGKDVGRGRTSPARRTGNAGRRRAWSGPGPDVRDPQAFLAGFAETERSIHFDPELARCQRELLREHDG